MTGHDRALGTILAGILGKWEAFEMRARPRRTSRRIRVAENRVYAKSIGVFKRLYLGKIELPRQDYKVSYVEDREGPYVVDAPIQPRGCRSVHPDGEPVSGTWFPVCWLPRTWPEGMRVRRIVEELRDGA